MEKKHFVLMSIIVLFTSMTFFCVREVMAQYIKATTAELTDEAENIVRGTVKDMKSEWNVEKTFIWTFVTVSVTRTIKGDILDKKDIIVKIPDGVVGNIGQKSSHAVTFKKGEDVLLFLKKEVYREEELFQVVRLLMGKFTIEKNNVVEKELSLDSFMEEIKRSIKK